MSFNPHAYFKGQSDMMDDLSRAYEDCTNAGSAQGWQIKGSEVPEVMSYLGKDSSEVLDPADIETFWDDQCVEVTTTYKVDMTPKEFPVRVYIAAEYAVEEGRFTGMTYVIESPITESVLFKRTLNADDSLWQYAERQCWHLV